MPQNICISCKCELYPHEQKARHCDECQSVYEDTMEDLNSVNPYFNQMPTKPSDYGL